ncbi:MAG: Hpt domain-containing protein [Oscillospiraceae bacterium]|nr:Hpt domain-containing protein [Oscillospiraceae bacterium]
MINQPQAGNTEKKVAMNDRLLGIFARDATNTIETINSIMSTSGEMSEEDLRKYVISVHGIKSALAYIGEPEMSAEALKLETAGRAEDMATINEQTPAFVAALQSLVDDIQSKQQPAATANVVEDKDFLAAQFAVIKMSAEDFDEDTVSMALSALKDKTWSEATNKLLEDISTALLHSDFDKIAEIASI